LKVYHHIEEFEGASNAAVTTGTFDGVHIGHQKILKRLIEVAKKAEGESVLLTFYPHPRMVLQPDVELKMLNSQKEKINRLELAGIDHLIIHPFTKGFSRLSSIEFVRDILVDKIGTKKLVIGYDHHFGRNREGSFEHLVEYGPTYGFDVEEISALDVDHVNVSSTKIRNALIEGDLETASTYLSYDYEFSGKVVKGKQIGRSIGFPTANVDLESSHKLIPADGVYAVQVKIKNSLHYGMLNIGLRPTVSDENTKSVEVNIFDFEEELYDSEITVIFKHRVRDEQRFSSVENLKTQLEKDKQACKRQLNIL
jgi:riboflavin kinase/FMN adenylyltransferase